VTDQAGTGKSERFSCASFACGRMVRTGRPCQHGGVPEFPADGDELPTSATEGAVPVDTNGVFLARTGEAFPAQAGDQQPEGSSHDSLARRHGSELTPAELATRRRNRRLMSFVLAPSLVIGGLALLATFIASSDQSSLRPLQVPAGYKAINDGYFAYAVPSGWSTSSAYTDDVGDLDTQGATGWAAEHVDARPNPSVPGETPPTAFRAFGEPQPAPFQTGPPTPIQVPGATVAYRYTITRPRFQATAVDLWQTNSGAEVWLLVDANPSITQTILGSLKG